MLSISITHIVIYHLTSKLSYLYLSNKKIYIAQLFFSLLQSKVVTNVIKN